MVVLGNSGAVSPIPSVRAVLWMERDADFVTLRMRDERFDRRRRGAGQRLMSLQISQQELL